MKKRFLIIILILVGLGFAGLAKAEEINNLIVGAYINKDGSVVFNEIIEYDFGTEQKHGIFRDIPIKYRARGGNYNLRVSDVSVVDENNHPYKFQVFYPGNDIQIKIGDADKYVTGKKIYLIKYKIERAINYFSDHDELYWNVTGNAWSVPIKHASIKIYLPETLDIDVKGLDKTCFVGLVGEKNYCSSEYVNENDVGNHFKINSVLFESDKLGPNEGMTSVVSFPKGVIQPTIFQIFLTTLQDNLILGLPFVVLIGLLIYWYRFGRDPKGIGIIIAQFDAPDKLSPAEIGTIIDEKAQNKDLSAEIVDLAIRGYLKITRTEEGALFKTTDYTFKKLKELDDLENDFDKKLMQSIFKSESTVNLSSLKNEMYKEFREAIKMLYTNVVKKGYFTKNPQAIRTIFSTVGIVIAFSAIHYFNDLGYLYAIAFVLTGIIFGIFGFVMPKKTQKGVEAKEYIQGLKLYLSVAEKDRINFHNAPEKNPEMFEKFLPYAMVLGVEKQWAKQFEGIYNQNPNWYNDTTGARFSALVFASHMSNFSQTAGSTMATAPGKGSGFSGGGSGGGFGGGGGGSW